MLDNSKDDAKLTAPAAQTSSLWILVMLSAMAGGMGWGIRGQYGHQTGAMLAGLLVGLVLVLRLVPHWPSLSGARVVAFLALGVSLGGSMTYGQTVGLTHDAALIGNWEALRWGLLGLFVKGGIWIGLAGFFLALGLNRSHYHPLELALLVMAAVLIRLLGVHLFNQPYQPDNLLLPTIYFSDDWYWEPDSELKPRREMWGGLLLAMLALVSYTRLVRHDRLAWRLAAWGFVAGGIGFASGQSVQAFHAWNRDWFLTSWVASYDSLINWWNMMEITFGALWGAILAAGVWLHRSLIAPVRDSCSSPLTRSQEWLLLLVHAGAIVAWSFGDYPELEFFADMGFTMVLIPVAACAAGRLWPFTFVLSMVLLPIAGKTVRQLSYNTELISVGVGWLSLVIVPLVITTWLAIVFSQAAGKVSSRVFAARSLLLLTWIYFGLNFAFFEFPWPWSDWTGRTPSAIIFVGCAVGLSLAAVLSRRATAETANHSLPEQGQLQ